MTDLQFLQILALAMPFVILLAVLLTIRIAIWQDARWDREQAERKRKAQG
jgi:hypothetical protein